MLCFIMNKDCVFIVVYKEIVKLKFFIKIINILFKFFYLK